MSSVLAPNRRAAQATDLTQSTASFIPCQARGDLMRLTINDMEIVFAPKMQTLDEAARALGLTRIETRMFERFYGLRQFPHDESQNLTALIEPALQNIVGRHAAMADDIKLCVHCHTIPSVTPFDAPILPSLVRRVVGEHVEYAGYTMSHCATGLVALEQLASWLGDDEYALVIIAEKAFHPKVQLIADTTIMGEAACVLLVSRRPGPVRLLGTTTTRDGQFSINSGHFTDASPMHFPHSYTDFVCRHIIKSLEHAGLDLNDIAHIAPHNVNLTSWKDIERTLSLPAGKIVMENIAQYGHCFGADPFINLQHLIETRQIKPGDKVLLISIGLGITAASAIVEYVPEV
ncbi:3-oxoacyl-[acyl-carrier-protein] synthase III C-terminal domain-containing protein [Lonsdalea quercina]|uniref:3-oxoacyl-[acyl-carrier-protein] synthase III C-terminal domain-containing protein n=2 Tax=Lonsdalea quercina TaxID=71657 RepID=UPI0039761C3A